MLRTTIAGLVAISSVLALAPMATAQADLGLKGLGVKAGFALPEDPIDNTFALGAHGRFGTVMPSLAVDGFVDLWFSGYDEAFVGYSYDWSWTQIAVGALAKYLIPVTGNITPYVAGGLALHYGRFSWDTDVPAYPGAATSYSDSDLDIGIHLVGGAQMPLSPTMDGVAELKYALDGADYIALTVGVVFKMGG